VWPGFAAITVGLGQLVMEPAAAHGLGAAGMARRTIEHVNEIARWKDAVKSFDSK
jgi:hypothetical protein